MTKANEPLLVLGIDTSNYTTSLALVDTAGTLIREERKLLTVREGERGLRQQEALFQHVQNFPALSKALFAGIDPAALAAVSVSTRPRPVEGSYMPCFTAGMSLGHSMAAALGIPCYEFSHQEGHIEAAWPETARPEGLTQFHAFHMSGGTCEVLEVTEQRAHDRFAGYSIRIIGGTKDISFGQVLDRIGVYLGMGFPAGAEMDRIACGVNASCAEIPRVKVQDRWIHLSGFETAVRRVLGDREADSHVDASAVDEEKKTAVIHTLLDSFAKAIGAMTEGLGTTLLVGGVSESTYIRNALAPRADIVFGAQGMGRDNAIGIARLGSRVLWQEDQSASIS